MGDETRWLTEREQRAWRTLHMMKMRIDGELARQLSDESNLSFPDYAVLVALTDRAEGRARIFELAGYLGWEKSRVSHHVSRMVSRGLVAREPCSRDRRGAVVLVTELGRSELTAAAPGHVAAVRRLFISPLTDAQLDALADAAETILAGFDEPFSDSDASE